MIQTKHEIKKCERCTTEFECKVGDIGNCQCSTVSISEATQAFLAQAHFDCLCKNCLHALNEKMTALEGKILPKNNALELNFHYYMEGQYLVFTENYHILRGYCCQSGCRHCPYGFEEEENKLQE